VALDRISEGVDHLNLDSPTDVSTMFPSPGGATSSAIPGSVAHSASATSMGADKNDPSDVYEPKGEYQEKTL